MTIEDPGAGEGLDEAADDELDLSPRTGPSVSTRPRRRVVLPWIVLALVVAGIGVLVTQLGNATVYFYNVDEAVARRDELGESRFRIQGSVIDEAAHTGEAIEFTISYGGVDVPVASSDGAPELFALGVPVVLEGHFAEGSTTFLADRILVKHSEEYEEENPEHVDDFVGEDDAAG